ncbi:asparagine synthase (glutamine-hydrolyzing) [Candidatus Peregrinibacteria bacterium]|nr:asparagine synthase (glutamine-hydrolyzing) [Candidatus Peregrinibacteria bacterium]
MCGIAGIFHFKNNSTVDENLLKRMSDTLAYRGPDDDGIFISKNKKCGFGFRRLAIIDLSPAGHQPMSNEDGNIWTMLNGEIYNFEFLKKELQQKGHAFKSKTDTETIIHNYEEKGINAINDLNGMFAIALWDETRQKLFLVRDRLGIKPLYYTIQNGTIIFGSEIKTILACSGVKRKLDEQALFHYLTFSCCPAPHTLFEGIKKLPAGHYLEIDENGAKEIQYWDAINRSQESEVRGQRSEEYFIEKIRSLLENSVEQQMVCDVPFGVFLSGGIDSSTNVALMTASRGQSVDSFSVNIKSLPKYDEFSWARKVAKIFNSNHHEITIGPQDLMNFLPTLAHHNDDPNGDPVCFPLYYVSKLIRDSGVIMAQVGEGSDELFAGYNQYLLTVNFWKKWRKLLEKLPLSLKKLLFNLSALTKHPAYDLHREQLRRLEASEEFFWGGAIAFSEFTKWDLFTGEFRKKMDGHSSFDIIKPFYKKIDSEAPDTDFLNRMIYLELKIRLPELLLMRVDKITMANSIESRVPFLDHRLVELAMQIPMDLKIKNGISKYALKQAVRGIIPDEIIDRKKQGFSAPIAEWLKQSLQKELPNVIWNSKIWETGVFNRKTIEKLIKDHQNNKADLSFRIWNILTLCIWFDHWMA